jgi:ABC-type multidrug transport system fused ATPase/permease subunit
LAAAQVLSGIKDVKLSSRSALFVRNFSEAYRVTSRTHARLNALQQIVPIGLPLLGQTILVGVALMLIGAGRSRGAVAGEMALLLLVTSRVVPSIGQLASSAGLLASVAPYVDAIHELRRSIAKSQREAARPASEPWDGEWRSLRLRDVGYQYPASEAAALRNLSLEITAGHAHGIAGPSGAGKSTLVDLLLALLDPAQGQLLLDGKPFEKVDRAAWQARIGYVPQSPYIADDTLRANVAFGVHQRDVDDAWVKACLERAQLGELLAELPQGLDTSMGDRGTRVSGGQRQRIAVARALYNRPKLLVLDEATSALDRISESAIQEAIRALRGSVTTVTIAHRLSTIRHCDAIFLLDRGQLVDQGGYDALLERQPLFRQMASDETEAEPQAAGVAL